MAENSGIVWTHHSYNPWIGCTKVSSACDFCYAELWDNRWKSKTPTGSRWGPKAPRTRTKTQRGPRKWNRLAAAAGVREQVFCASLADVFDNHKSIQQEWRDDLWSLIRETPSLDWLLLTKRPQNIKRYLPDDWGDGYDNVWLGTTAEDQAEFDRRTPHLTSIPAKVRFLSMEPLLGPVDMGDMLGLDWIIAGGESGANFRPVDPDWFRSLRDQCKDKKKPFLFKQWAGKKSEIKKLGRELDGVIHDEYPLAA